MNVRPDFPQQNQVQVGRAHVAGPVLTAVAFAGLSSSPVKVAKLVEKLFRGTIRGRSSSGSALYTKETFAGGAFALKYDFR